MKKYLNTLKQCPLFSDITDTDLLNMLQCLNARIDTFARNQTIFMEGTPAASVGIVLSGAVAIVRDDYYGNRTIIAHIEEMQLFAETFACADIEHMPVSAIAACDSEIMFIDCKRILTICSNTCKFHTLLVNNLLRIVATKNILLNQKIEVTAKRTTRDKLMTYLMIQAKKNNADTFTIPYDRQALADYLGVERSAMSAEISKLRKEGIIECRKNLFRLL